MSNSRIIIACAGAGKTTRLVSEALASRDRRIALVSYTNNNIREISKRFGELNSGVPKHVNVMTWFTFLLRECARPYQRAKYADKRIESLVFVNQRSARYVAESDTRHHYFSDAERMYSDKIARFVVECEKNSSGCVTNRLRQVYTDVLIDEFQDLSGWDMDVVLALLAAGMRCTIVGDPRQHIYSTNPAARNRQYRGVKIIDLVDKWKRVGLCAVEYMSGSHRCNQAICDFANALWPGIDPMTSMRSDARSPHDGVFVVDESAVEAYIRQFNPQVLRHNKSAKAYACEALNFGAAKGLQFRRVLIVPTGPIKEYLRDGAVSHVEDARERLHVAVTRAFDSVAFVYDGSSRVVARRWVPGRISS